jgi:hypothetical protein
MDLSFTMRSRPDPIRLKPVQRYLLYAVLALLFFSGVAWSCWTYLVASPPEEFDATAKVWAMKIHGAGAMAILVLVGMLLNGHVKSAWRARRNRKNGSIFLTTFGVLTVTGYGLYYAGGEMLRQWTSWIHLVVGLGLPILLIIHIQLGKRTRRSGGLRNEPRFASPPRKGGHPKRHHYQAQCNVN